ncbi:MAG TPA: hypothetical protein VK735_14530 [Pseudonocardia sp.]|uniref:hypothetical protein n=1 Tax=Pseudonocardia sp. TaxID=60912 RepID=UPI002C48C59D|nr:hypothetical protein [Pseudonocardia sp.]HTF48659.1 hypothetical protein [Pseudonocardia sp.]
MNSSNRHRRGQATVVARGDLHDADIVGLCAQISGLIDVGVHAVVLDLSRAAAGDPDTRRSLVWLQDRMRTRGVALSILTSDPPAPRRSAESEAADASDSDTTPDHASAPSTHCEQPSMPGYRPETADQP